ncbi:hypothetical protein ASPCADRAFT_212191 [Aspergillus carbonarius ITEM 5010]|uniref:Uncharacterized protein n=1 Tax=Aspergillus carbonarius (strain ITEM 5010) TaxID=602072 RepID=A0A1R3R6N1_ASPC5|nr:hypothetical protein ASPCADRAFT_212191 [Aspergillus carbonarius ITEM 5010]
MVIFGPDKVEGVIIRENTTKELRIPAPRSPSTAATTKSACLVRTSLNGPRTQTRLRNPLLVFM